MVEAEFSRQPVFEARHLGIVGEEAHEATDGDLVGIHEPSHDLDEPARHHRQPADPRLDPCTRATGLSFSKGARREVGVWEMNPRERRTGEVANGDGDDGDGGEVDVVRRREVANHLGEGWVAVHHRVLWLHRRGDVRVHRGCSGRESSLVLGWRRAEAAEALVLSLLTV